MTTQPTDPDDPGNVHRLFPLQRPEEWRLHAALRARQDLADRFDSFTIWAQPDVWVRTGRRFRPDFVVALRSTLAVEIDGSWHTGRYCADRSKDELLLDHNLPVLRIPVEDLDSPVLVEDWVDRILARIRRFQWGAA